MRRTRQSVKHYSPDSSDDEPLVKKKSPAVSLVSQVKMPQKRKRPKRVKDSDGSSSESDIGDYLQAADKIDLNSSFFDIQKKDETRSFEKIEKDIFAGVTRLSDSDSDEDMDGPKKVTEDPPIPKFEAKLDEDEPSATQKEKSETIAKLNFQQLEAFTRKIEEAKKEVEKYEAQKQAAKTKSRQYVEEKKVDISKLLEAGEKNNPESSLTMEDFHSSDFESGSDSEKGDWEEVKAKDVQDTKEKRGIPKDGLQITVEMPDTIRKKKKVDLLTAMKRRLNRIRKENQVYVHKVHLLCWIAHGNYVNSIINNEKILGLALSLLPSQQSYPSGRTDLKYLEQILQWYKKTVKLTEKPLPKINNSLPNILEQQIIGKKAFNKKMCVYIFIAVLRALGIQCRLVLSFQVEPLRPPASELHSLGAKPEAREIEKKSKVSESDSLKKETNQETKAKPTKAANKNTGNEKIVEVNPKAKEDTKTQINEIHKNANKGKNILAKNTKGKKDAKNKINGEGSVENSSKGQHSEKKQAKGTKNSGKGSKMQTDTKSNKSEPTVKTEKSKKENTEVKAEKSKKEKIENLVSGLDVKSRITRSRSNSPAVFSTNIEKTVSSRKSTSKADLSSETKPQKRVKTVNSNIKSKNKNELPKQTRHNTRIKKEKDIPQADGCYDSETENSTVSYKKFDSSNVCLNDIASPSLSNVSNSCDLQSNALFFLSRPQHWFAYSVYSDIKLPQLDGTDDTSTKLETKTKPKPSLNKLKKPVEDECSVSKHPKRLTAIANDKEIDSAEEFQPKEVFKKRISESPVKSQTKASANIKKLKEVKSKQSDTKRIASSLPDKSKYFASTSSFQSSVPAGADVRNDIIGLIKGRIKEQNQADKSKKVMKRKSVKKGSDGDTGDNDDSDYVPELVKKKDHDSDDDYFIPKVKVKRRVPVKKAQKEGADRRVLSSDSEGENAANKKKKGVDVWAEVFLENEEKWISVDVIQGQVHCINQLFSRATHPVSYIVAWNNDNTLKDVTRRYCNNYNTVTRKLRTDAKWWEESLKPFQRRPTARDKEEDDELRRMQLDKPLPTSIAEYKNHPLYVLKRHLLKFEGIYPPDAPTLGFVRSEAVYPRDCLYTLCSRDIWLKQAKVVKIGETPYKIVKARPKYDKLSNTVISDQMLELFGPWQTQDYEPPTAENGVVPRNAYGNVELFKPCMLPKKTVHLRLPGLNKIARRMDIDCATAIIGFDFHSGWSHPTYDGFVVCEEFADQLVIAWELEQEEIERKEQEKMEKRVYDNWKKLIKGLLIRERLKARYDFGASTSGKKEKKKSKAPTFCTKRTNKKRRKISSDESDSN